MSGLKQTFVTKITDINSSAQEPLGSVRIEGNKIYKYCEIKNVTGTVAGAAGSLVAYNAASGYDNNKVVIKLADADAAPFAAGALSATVTGTLAVSYFGWVQTKGACTLDTAVTTGGAGKGFTLTTTDKTGTVAIATDLSPYAGVSVNSTTGVVLDCPL